MLKSFPTVVLYRGPLHERVKPGYLALYDAINELGRKRYGSAWTGREILTPAMPRPESPSNYSPNFRLIKSHGEPSGFSVFVATGEKKAQTRDEAIKIWTDHLPEMMALYESAYANRQRHESAIRELRDALSLGRIAAYVWDRKRSGAVFAINQERWDADEAEQTLDLTDPRNLTRKAYLIEPAQWRAPNQAFASGVNSYSGVIDSAVVEADSFRAWLNGAPEQVQAAPAEISGRLRAAIASATPRSTGTIEIPDATVDEWFFSEHLPLCKDDMRSYTDRENSLIAAIRDKFEGIKDARGHARRLLKEIPNPVAHKLGPKKKKAIGRDTR